MYYGPYLRSRGLVESELVDQVIASRSIMVEARRTRDYVRKWPPARAERASTSCKGEVEHVWIES